MTVSSKKQGVMQKNVQNMIINAGGPMIVGPDLLIGGASVARTNPTSMRDKIKIDNPGAKILTPRTVQIQNTTTLTAGGENTGSLGH